LFLVLVVVEVGCMEALSGVMASLLPQSIKSRQKVLGVYNRQTACGLDGSVGNIQGRTLRDT